MAALDPVEYDRCRKDAAKELGISVSTLDKEVEALRRAEHPPEGAGTALQLEDIEPWGGSVHGLTLVQSVVEALKNHVMP